MLGTRYITYTWYIASPVELKVLWPGWVRCMGRAWHLEGALEEGFVGKFLCTSANHRWTLFSTAVYSNIPGMSQLYFQVIWPRHGVAVLCCVGHAFKVLFKTATTFLEKKLLGISRGQLFKTVRVLGGKLLRITMGQLSRTAPTSWRKSCLALVWDSFLELHPRFRGELLGFSTGQVKKTAPTFLGKKDLELVWDYNLELHTRFWEKHTWN